MHKINENGSQVNTCTLFSSSIMMFVVAHVQSMHADFFLTMLTLETSCRAELQIQTTQDYATDSWFFNVFTG